MKSTPFYVLFFGMLIFSCNTPVDTKNAKPGNIGDIAFDSELDDSDFKVCDEYRSRQYYNGGTGLSYDGEKQAILVHFEENYEIENLQDQNGYVTIRFIVNCERKTGRFRISSMNMNYEEVEFDKRITSQLLKLTKQLDGWNFPPPKRRKLDYYQYLTFKIYQGQIKEILP